MNRNLIILLFSLSAASCTGRLTLDMVPAEITFGASADAMDTKALVNNTTALQTDHMLGAYGMFTYQTHASKVYEGNELKYEVRNDATGTPDMWRAWDGSRSNWISKYWIEGSDYRFTLVSPYSAPGTAASGANIGSGAVDYDYTTGGYTIPVTEVSKGSPDLMVGSAQRNIPVEPSETDFRPVEVNMKHAFAAVEFKIMNSSGKTIVGINDVKFTGLKVDGTLTVLPSGEIGLSNWTTSGTANSTNYTNSGDIPGSTNFVYGTNEAVSVFSGPVVVIPQLVEVGNASEHIYFSFKYKRDKESTYTDSIQYDLSDPSIVEAYGFRTWEAGKKYIYTATITTNTIIFQVDVKDWRDGGTYILE